MGRYHRALFLYLFYIGVEGTKDLDQILFGNYCQHKCKCINRCLDDDQSDSELVNEKQKNQWESTSFPSFVVIGGLSAIILLLFLVVCIICRLYRLLRVSLAEKEVVKRKQRVRSPSWSEAEQRSIQRDSSIYLNVKKHLQLNNTNMALPGGGDVEDVQHKHDPFTPTGSDQSNLRSSAPTANSEEDFYEKLSMKNHQSETKY